MRYRDLKDERDAAVARAVEAERLSMKSEFDRVTAEFEREKKRLLSLTNENARLAYRNGFNAGLDAIADDIADRLKHRIELVPPSLRPSSVEQWQRVVGVPTEMVFTDPDTEAAVTKFQKGNDDATENPRTT